MLNIFHNKYKKFWKWFEKNSDSIFNLEKNQESIFDLLSQSLSKVNPDLKFEFGPIENNKREFVISAGGILGAFKDVESLYKSKPDLEKWIFIKFRPRRNPINSVTIGNITLSPEDIQFILFKSDNTDKTSLLLYIRNLNADNLIEMKNLGYLILDEAIGEYDTETFIGGIGFQPFGSEYFEKSFSINQLASHLDYWKNNGTTPNTR